MHNAKSLSFELAQQPRPMKRLEVGDVFTVTDYAIRSINNGNTIVEVPVVLTNTHQEIALRSLILGCPDIKGETLGECYSNIIGHTFRIYKEDGKLIDGRIKRTLS